MQMKFETEIRRSPKDLWPWLTEPERMKKWMKGLVSIVPNDPGPTRAGSTSKMTVKEGGKLVTYDETILEWNPPRSLRLRLTSPQWKSLQMTMANQLEDLGPSTRLHYQFECQTTNAFFKLLGFLFGFFAKLQAKSFMKSLKHLAESEPATR
jgi:uncharacterized protein YndB with AHSA1/START domain